MKLIPAIFLSALVSIPAFAVQTITFTNKEVDGAKVWEPSTTSLKANEDIEIKIVNQLKDVHGFEVPGMTEKLAIPAAETKTVLVKAPKAGEYSYKCHLHPKHVGGSFKVQ